MKIHVLSPIHNIPFSRATMGFHSAFDVSFMKSRWSCNLMEYCQLDWCAGIYIRNYCIMEQEEMKITQEILAQAMDDARPKKC